jgi:enoyl-CoA hydratase/carnithine racemase
MNPSLVFAEMREHVALLTLNHPQKRNALSREMLTQLLQNLERIGTDRSAHVVILKAVAPVFSSGHDLKELAACKENESQELFTLCTRVMEAIRLLRQPVIAEVQGLATAAGCQLAATCDLVVAADNAWFATPGVRIGLFCTTPAVALVRAVQPKKALEMLLTGDPIDARAAERIGLVNRVVPADRLEEETWQLARKIASASPEVVALGKRAFYQQLPLDYPQAYAVAVPIISANAQLPDAQEGMRAFLEKRPPRWGGSRP